ncbi:MAG: GNAT family N-acetyltransferase [Anaerolineales bacterium]
MTDKKQVEINLRLWSQDDLTLLERLLGDPAMTKHIGGPESPEKIRKRLERYCQDSAISKVHMFVVTFGEEHIPVGSIGYWEKIWQSQEIWETGWRILPEYQGHGIASRATALVIERARREREYRSLHAFPAIDNEPSNAICRKVGFQLLGEVSFEYPPGRFMRSNDWCLNLFE